MNHVKRVAAPTYDRALLDVAKQHVRVTTNDEDALLGLYLDGVIASCENRLQTAILNTQFELHANFFTTNIDLQKKWVSAINSVKYYDADGVLTTVSSANYSLQDFKEPNVLSFNVDYDFPETDDREFPVVVNFNAGFTAASSILPNVRNAIFLELADRYENRQNEVVADRVQVVMFNNNADRLLAEECLYL